MRTNILITLITLATTLLAACDSNDPIASLRNNSVSKNYDENYWIKQHDENTLVWQKAWNLCNSNPSYAIQPNCQVIGNVMMVAALSASAKHLHRHNHADGFGADNFPNISGKHPSSIY